MRRRNGIALVAVLWVLVLLSVVAAAFLNETRTETKLARNLVDNAKARALADAGVHRAVFALLPSPGAASRQTRPMLGPRVGQEAARRDEEEPEVQNDWRADGKVRAWGFGGGEVRISIHDEAGKIDLNRAPDELLKGLFVSAGVGEGDANALVDAIADFRDADDLKRLNGAEDDDYRDLAWEAKDAPFETVAELQQVIGMTRELYDRVAPYLTVYSRRRGRIDPATAPEAVLRAIPGVDDVAVGALLDARSEARGAPGETALPALTGVKRYVGRSRGQVFTIRAEAVTERGAHFVREAVVRLTPNHPRPFRIHAWRQGERTTETSAER